MGRFINKAVDEWGGYVYAKVNAPELLKVDIKKLKNKGKDKSILLSSVTDPYQGLEAKYKLTRQCLEVLADYNFEGTVSVLTKSHLVLRDIDVLKEIKHTDIGITITTTSDKVSRYFEKYAPSASKRLETLKKLNDFGFQTYAFVGPLLPHFVAKEKTLEKLFSAIAKTGNKDVYVEHINLSKYILERFKKEAKDIGPKTLEAFTQTQRKAYQEQLDTTIKRLIKKYKLRFRLGATLSHKIKQ